MQLALLFIALLACGKDKNVLKEVKPFLEELGGEEVKSALSAVEELEGVLDLVKTFTGGQTAEFSAQSNKEGKEIGVSGYPLDPVAKITDKNITYSLSKYFAENP